MGVFQRVVERGSFAGAAEDMGLSPSAVSKLITRLELRLGVRLINRTTRRLALTPEGEIAHMLLRLAIEGAGIIRFGDVIVARAIQQGLLEPILEELQEPESFPFWAILPPGRQRTPKVKVFLDFLMERFGSAPWRTKCSK